MFQDLSSLCMGLNTDHLNWNLLLVHQLIQYSFCPSFIFPSICSSSLFLSKSVIVVQYYRFPFSLIAPMMGRGVLAGPRIPFGVNPLTFFNNNNANNNQDQDQARIASDFDDSDDDIPEAALPPNQRGR